MRHHKQEDPYEEADRAARMEAVTETGWKIAAEVARFSAKEDIPMTKAEIGRALVRHHGIHTGIEYQVRKLLKQGLLIKVGSSMSGGVTYGLSEAGSRLVGRDCPIYNEDGPLERLDLSRTKAALETYDRLYAKYDEEIDGLGDEEALAALDHITEAEGAVGKAFAEDTKDRNSRDVARFVKPGPWVRRLVEKYGGQ